MDFQKLDAQDLSKLAKDQDKGFKTLSTVFTLCQITI